MMSNHVVPRGYKQTKVGVIPKEWEVVRLGDICDKKAKYGINASAVKFDKNLPVYLRITDIDEKGNFNPQKISSVKDSEYKKFILEENELVLARTGATVGKSYLYNKKDGELVYAGFLIKISPNIKKLNSIFLKNYLFTSFYWYWVKTMSVRSGQPGINAEEYSLLPIPLPPLKEQQKIAEILTTWDDAISKLDKLIASKEQLKKGLMQKLLSGEIRFDGFDGEWEEVRLGDIGEFKTSSVDKKIYEGEKLIKLLNYMDVYKNKKIDNSYYNFTTVSASDTQIKTNNLKKGDIVFTPSSETAEDIGYSSVILEDLKNVLHSYHVVRFRINIDMDLGFKGYVFNNERILKEFSKRATGSTRFTLSIKDFNDALAMIPAELKEQQKIAEVLSNADKEIDLLKNELEELKEQKKGLMQKLLTGEVRVKI